MSHRLLYDIVDIVYLLNGNGVKRENLFKRSNFFNAQNQLRWIKNFAELQNVTLNAISIQHVALFNIFCDCEIDPECFWDSTTWFHPKTGKKSEPDWANWQN